MWCLQCSESSCVCLQSPPPKARPRDTHWPNLWRGKGVIRREENLRRALTIQQEARTSLPHHGSWRPAVCSSGGPSLDLWGLRISLSHPRVPGVTAKTHLMDVCASVSVSREAARRGVLREDSEESFDLLNLAESPCIPAKSASSSRCTTSRGQ